MQSCVVALTSDFASAKPTPLSLREGWLKPSGSSRGQSPASTPIGLDIISSNQGLFVPSSSEKEETETASPQKFESRALSVLLQPREIVFGAAPWIVAVILFCDQPG
jgi:hypothetical protein